ncbi:hypothetical protein HZF08_36350 [Paenibacillus sp. CGMCC 1.16610]|uniref:DUF4111 domain-containing protein n=1 Tax=Paenibacillus anseongense TaxID=2682845 RepID=A0ABW9UBW1_9BACL|nr:MULTISPECIES: hypothetical protein [Paenibacillus]MBA2943748.1 hypothetical protein [Paenibacillus sp. CGMCC 1.16610]MVQ37637.1 hypothetical protein [Paenibacillus anseongense]
MTKWERALSKVCECLESRSNLEWLLVGSVGSVLQGCEMSPGDVDIYVKNKEEVEQIADLFKEFSLVSKCEPPHGEKWLSSLEEPTFTQTFGSGFTWTKGCWLIEDFKVEIVQISNSAGIPDSLDGEGIWEGGQFVWSHSREIYFGKHIIRTVPLEIQLESNLRRKRTDRIQSILASFKKYGYDNKLIQIALSKENLIYFYNEMDIIIN